MCGQEIFFSRFLQSVSSFMNRFDANFSFIFTFVHQDIITEIFAMESEFGMENYFKTKKKPKQKFSIPVFITNISIAMYELLN